MKLPYTLKHTDDEAHYLFNGSLTFCASSRNFRRVAQYATVSAFSYPIQVWFYDSFFLYMSCLDRAKAAPRKKIKKNYKNKNNLISYSYVWQTDHGSWAQLELPLTSSKTFVLGNSWDCPSELRTRLSVLAELV